MDPDLLQTELDLQRRSELRTFLTDCRNRLGPGACGLPKTLRRRVEGLRRCEVAELVGVTPEWYRYFESGRPIRVSPQLVHRLSAALQLTAEERMTLFRLSLPEVYQAAADLAA